MNLYILLYFIIHICAKKYFNDNHSDWGENFGKRKGYNWVCSAEGVSKYLIGSKSRCMNKFDLRLWFESVEIFGMNIWRNWDLALILARSSGCYELRA